MEMTYRQIRLGRKTWAYCGRTGQGTTILACRWYVEIYVRGYFVGASWCG